MVDDTVLEYICQKEQKLESKILINHGIESESETSR